MTQIIGMVGFIGSGKDTVAKHIAEHRNVEQHSFAAPLKDAVSVIFGWPRHLLEGDTAESRDFRETPDMFWSRKLDIPNFTPRLALQLIGTDVLRNHFHSDIWVNCLEYRVLAAMRGGNTVIVSDARFQNELSLIKQMGGKIIWVRRGELPEWYDLAAKANTGHEASRHIMTTKYSDIHESEWGWAGINADYIIDNDGSLEELYEATNSITRSLIKTRLTAV